MLTATAEVPTETDLFLILQADLADAQQSLSDSIALAEPAELSSLADIAKLLAKAQQELIGCTATKAQTSRILLVEDHAGSASATRALLQQHGHQVAVAYSGESARKMFLVEQFDLLICDIGLPDECGCELMKELHANFGVAGIALSGRTEPADLKKSAAAGFTAHVSKPFDVEHLLSVISRVSAVGPAKSIVRPAAAFAHSTSAAAS